MRDCDNCARHTPSGCTSWKCDYINREEAIEAWIEKHRTEKEGCHTEKGVAND